MTVLALPFDTSSFTLDASGIAGLVGGDEAVSALAVAHIYQNRRWLGWYNSPGSLQMAKRLSLLAKSRIPNTFSPDLYIDPAKFVELDTIRGPKFRATQSGTVFDDTGYFGSLVLKKCASLDRNTARGRMTEAIEVTVIKLKEAPEKRLELAYLDPNTPFFASIPIFVSLSGCVTCGILGDWFAFGLILIGILANGISSLVVGSGKLQFTHPHPASGSPAGDGILISGKQIVLLRGAEGAVNSLTRGNLSLSFCDDVVQRYIEWCSILFAIQFVAQALLISQASLLGQILFVVSLTVSWIYNCFLALHKDKIQQDILFDTILKEPYSHQRTFGTFTSAIVFALLVLRPREPMKFLNELFPDTDVWKQCKKTIVQQYFTEDTKISPTYGEADEFIETDKQLLEKLLRDAETAHDEYIQLPPEMDSKCFTRNEMPRSSTPGEIDRSN